MDRAALASLYDRGQIASADVLPGMSYLKMLLAGARCDDAQAEIVDYLDGARIDDASEITAEDHVLLIEQHPDAGSMYVTAHASAADAVAYHDETDDSGYEIRVMIDLDDGEVYDEAVVRTEVANDHTLHITSAVWTALDQLAGDQNQVLDIVNQAISTWAPKDEA